MILRSLLLLAGLMVNILISAQMTNPFDQPEELGDISWHRDYQQAIAESSKTGKPILILFQEVPGCSTCRNYGNDVLSNPILGEAMQHEFVPLAIFNNKGGSDLEILEKYGEPTWNNPVVRIVNGEGKDIVNRLAGNYSVTGLSERIENALFLSGIDVPKYLKLYIESLSQTEERYYQMYCFWSGEASLGSVDGVMSSEPGWINGAEVVKIEYDPNKVSAELIDKYGEEANCKQVLKHKSYRIDKDPQYYLKQTKYKHLALTPTQKSKINAALANGKDPSIYLSPTQFSRLNSLKVEDSKQLYNLPFDQAWEMMIDSHSQLRPKN